MHHRACFGDEGNLYALFFELCLFPVLSSLHPPSSLDRKPDDEMEKHDYAIDGDDTEEGVLTPPVNNEVFGDEAHHDIKYRTLSWPMVAFLMIAEIVSNGMLSLPSSGGVVGVRAVP